MKKYKNIKTMDLRSLLTSLVVMLAIPLGFSASPQTEVVAKISVKNLGDRSIFYSRSYNGIFNLEHIPLKLDEDSTVTLILPTDGMEYLNILASDTSWKLPTIHKSVWLQPGNTEISINPAEEKPIVVISGSGAEDNGLLEASLKKLGDGYIGLVANGFGRDEFNLSSDSVPSVIIKKLDNYIDSVCLKHKNDSNVNLDIFRSNAGLYKYMIFTSKYYRYKDDIEWKKAFEYLVKNTDFSSPYVGFFPYLQMVATDIFYKTGGADLISLSEDSLLVARADFYNTYFEGKMTEAALATLLLEDGNRGYYNLSVPELTEQFKSKYPDSPIIPLLEEQVVKNIAFNNPPEREGIVFRDNSDITTVEDILAPYKGKPVLIDLWATWCRPCLESFTHVEPLQNYAADNNLRLLYISIDEQPGIESKWRNIALLNNLKGDHVLMNPAVKDDIYSTFGSNGYMFIPCYAFVAPDGTIKVLGSNIAESKDFAVVKAELDKLMNK